MGLNELEEELTANAEKEISAIKNASEHQESSILSDARNKAKEIKAEALSEGKARAESERRGALASARLEAKRILNQAREEAVNENLNEIREVLSQIRDDNRYPKILQNLVDEGLKELGDDSTVYVNKGDEKLVKAKKISEKEIESVGGVIIESSDGRIRVDSTIDSLFHQKTEYLRRQIFSELFGKEAE
ncbi:MAG: V-type ATP synthase subunit E family protein [Candidatus Altiarchaeota archaeon]